MWTPISRSEFDSLLETQLKELTKEERAVLDQFKVPVCDAQIVRTPDSDRESVYVVARTEGGVMYFDDVEYGFNVSVVDENDRILNPGGAQFTLAEAVRAWLIPPS